MIASEVIDGFYVCDIIYHSAMLDRLNKDKFVRFHRHVVFEFCLVNVRIVEKYFTQLLMTLQSHIHLLRLVDWFRSGYKLCKVVLLMSCLMLDIR